VDIHGNESGFAVFSGTTDVAGGPPRELALARPSPNPARHGVGLRFVLPHESRVSLVVYDAAGRLVKRLVDGVHPAGDHTAMWDLRGESGKAVAGGIYLVRLESGPYRLTERIAVLR
jgi:hypothetical protein